MQTPRLDLRAVVAESARIAASLDSLSLGRHLAADIPASWPDPMLAPALPHVAAEYRDNPTIGGWGMWFILLREPRTLVGAAGFKGEPGKVGGPGTAEIGYGILPDFQRRGLATEAVAALIDWAFAAAPLHRVIAHTFELHEPSLGVLRNCGFEFAGPGFEPVDESERLGRGELVLWQISRGRWQSPRSRGPSPPHSA